MIEETSRQAGITRRTIATDEIVNRPLDALINEGAKVIEEGIALRAADVDIIYIYGYGFPPHRGGPMWYADTVGLQNVVTAMARYAKGRHGDTWTPAPLLANLAAEGKTFNT